MLGVSAFRYTLFLHRSVERVLNFENKSQKVLRSLTPIEEMDLRFVEHRLKTHWKMKACHLWAQGMPFCGYSTSQYPLQPPIGVFDSEWAQGRNKTQWARLLLEPDLQYLLEIWTTLHKQYECRVQIFRKGPWGGIILVREPPARLRKCQQILHL